MSNQSSRRLRNGGILHSRELMPTEIFPLALGTPIVPEATTLKQFNLPHAAVVGRLTLGLADTDNSTKLYVVQSLGYDAHSSRRSLAVIDGSYHRGRGFRHMLPLEDFRSEVLGYHTPELNMGKYVSREHVELISQAPLGNLIVRNLAPTNGTTIEWATPPPAHPSAPRV
ncbi:MAG TPA: hypothetical protein VD735_00180 [Candidatus Saccharimonadales bacterium]|nr:hypothetical protein [Candidatus Saccharimonadales bacterium]